MVANDKSNQPETTIMNVVFDKLDKTSNYVYLFPALYALLSSKATSNVLNSSYDFGMLPFTGELFLKATSALFCNI